MSKLVIVESPAKAKTIKKYLGKGYEIMASMGHLRDLPKSKMGIDIENDFEPQYINIKGKGQIIKNLKRQASKSDKVFLAADPDREGEAISWHLAYILGLDETEKNRITFNEITKFGIESGMKNPREINKNLVDAQQARRVLDRLVGYKLSPFLWKKVKPGLSAGRVQSVAVRLIVEREEEIEKFKPDEYWTIDLTVTKLNDSASFQASFFGKKNKKMNIKTEDEADHILRNLANGSYVVDSVKKGTRKKSPPPPFTTSTLQQEASRKLNFRPSKTMQIAQQLYEGVYLENHGEVGLITYMRTDSTRISSDAMNAAFEYIKTAFSESYLNKKPRIYKTKASVQDGHEAIRPAMPKLEPIQIKSSLSNDQYKLYKLIWERFIATQMADAIYDTVSVSITSGEYIFKTSGSVISFKGFTTIYFDEYSEKADENEQLAKSIPKLVEGEKLNFSSIEKNQHFTQPPPKFTEASLTKTLEELGIGRPSTYVPTISTIITRGYIEREKKQLSPTLLGKTINEIMKENFSDVVNVRFTAQIEEYFDKVAEGKMKWKDSIRNFYIEFRDTLTIAEKNTKNYKMPDEETDEICDKCGKNMVIKHGRFGKFLACSGYPDCKNTKKIVVLTKGICPSCKGKIVKQRSAKGRIFYGCENYPACDFVSWDEPSDKTCPICGNTLFKKHGKNEKLICINSSCKNDISS